MLLDQKSRNTCIDSIWHSYLSATCGGKRISTWGRKGTVISLVMSDPCLLPCLIIIRWNEKESLHMEGTLSSCCSPKSFLERDSPCCSARANGLKRLKTTNVCHLAFDDFMGRGQTRAYSQRLDSVPGCKTHACVFVTL